MELMLMIPFSLKYHVHIFTKIWLMLYFVGTQVSPILVCIRTLFSDTFDSVFTSSMILEYFYIVSFLWQYRLQVLCFPFNFLYILYFVLGHGVVQYFNVASAIYAKYKLHGFQYPPGNWIGVSFIDDGSNPTE